jgi:hexosaminidase
LPALLQWRKNITPSRHVSDTDSMENLDMIRHMAISHFCTRILVLAGMLACCGVSVGSPSQTNLHLLPMPKSLALKEGRLNIDNTFSLLLSGHVDARIQAAADRFLNRLQQKTGIPISKRFKRDSANAVLGIHCEGTGEAIQSPSADESYALEVADQGAR